MEGDKEGAPSRLPSQFWIVIVAEVAERASFIGVAALLANFSARELGLGEREASSIVSFFFAFCYLTPFVGGYFADRLIGPYRTVLIFAAICLGGHVALGFADDRGSLYVALMLLGLGAGAIKSTAPTMIGQVVNAGSDGAALGRAFSVFYAAINVAALIANLAVPLIRDRYGYAAALSAPLASMALALVILILVRRSVPPALLARPSLLTRDRPAVRAISPSLLRLTPFLAIYYFALFQGYSTWTLFITRQADLQLPLGIGRLAPEQVLAFNPLTIILLAPLVNWAWESFSRNSGSAQDIPVRVVLGFVVAAAGPLILAFAAYRADQGMQPSVGYAILATTVMAIAEILVAVSTLRLAYTGSGPGGRAFATAIFYGTIAAGNLLGGIAGSFFNSAEAARFFVVQSGLLILAGIGAGFILFRGRRGVQDGSEASA